MSTKLSVVILAGGTGGAKLARGLLDVAGELTVIANTGDDVEMYGAHVSPDPDLITFWLADLIDPRGWGLDGDTFAVMDGLRALGQEIWFNLGDRDLAIGRHRAELLRDGATLTEAHAAATSHLPQAARSAARVLPMSDRPVRTRVLAQGRWWSLQEFMIRGGGRGPVEDVQFRGATAAGTTPKITAAIAGADLIVIGPSNPVISIGPMLAIPELRKAIRAASAPVVAVSPIVGGEVLKGPTAEFLKWCGMPVSGSGIAALYGDLVDGIVVDDQVDTITTHRTNLLLDTPERRARLAAEIVAFADGL